MCLAVEGMYGNLVAMDNGCESVFFGIREF